MKPLLTLLGVLGLTTFLAAPRLGAGWFWDIGNGLGLAAFAGLLYLTLTGVRGLDVRAHQWLSYGVLIVVLLHVFWLLLGDAAVVEFMKPGAPDYMWHGIVSALLLIVLVVFALLPDRIKLHRDYPSFRYWHRVLAIACIATACYHIVVSGFYLQSVFQAALFVGVTAFVVFGRRWRARISRGRIANAFAFCAVAIVFALSFAAIRNPLP